MTIVASVVVLFLLMALPQVAPSSQSTGRDTSPPYAVQRVVALPLPHWSGDFKWSYSSADAAGSFVESGSGSFTFTVTQNPVGGRPWNITGSGTGTENYQREGASGRCSGSGTGTYTFQLAGYYYEGIDTFSMGLASDNFSPPSFTIDQQPPPNCLPDIRDFVGIQPRSWTLRAQDGATAECADKSCDGGITYRLTIHGGSTSTTTTSTSCTSTGDQKLIFYVEDDGFPSGHGFMQLQTNTGPQAGRTDLVYGHSSVSGPFNDGFTRGPGVPQHGLLEADHPWDWRIVFHVNPCQYNAAADFVNREIDHPSKYSLTTLNCVDWINDAASLAGLSLPMSTDFVGASDPSTLGDSFASIGNGGTFDGGIVQENTAHTTPRNTPDPPGPQETLLASPVEILGYALQNASALAASQNATLEQVTLQPVTVGADGMVNLALNNVPVNSSLMVMDFGDGSSNTTMSLQYSHVYHSPGVRHARLVVLTGPSFFNAFLLNVTVSAGSGSSATVSVPIPNNNAVQGSKLSSLAAERVALVGAAPTGGGVGSSAANNGSSNASSPPALSFTLTSYIAAGVVVVAAASIFFFSKRRVRR